MRRSPSAQFVKHTMVSNAGLEEFSCDGLQRNSFRKIKPNISATYRISIIDMAGYKRLLKAYVARPSNGKKWEAPLDPVNTLGM